LTVSGEPSDDLPGSSLLMVVFIAEFAAILKFINDLMAFKDLLRIFELFEEL
jgi:hypothetical protein